MTKSEVVGWYNSGKNLKKLKVETGIEPKIIKAAFESLGLKMEDRPKEVKPPKVKPPLFEIVDDTDDLEITNLDTNNEPTTTSFEVQDQQSVEVTETSAGVDMGIIFN